MKQFDNNVYICQQERTQELNDRIMDRNQPSIKMNNVYDPRPAETRRVIFPGIDTRHNLVYQFKIAVIIAKNKYLILVLKHLIVVLPML